MIREQKGLRPDGRLCGVVEVMVFAVICRVDWLQYRGRLVKFSDIVSLTSILMNEGPRES